jgi:hypothetical protein
MRALLPLVVAESVVLAALAAMSWPIRSAPRSTRARPAPNRSACHP